MLYTLHVLIYLILTTTLQARYYYYCHFTVRKQRQIKVGKLPRGSRLVRDRADVKPGCLALEFTLSLAGC